MRIPPFLRRRRVGVSLAASAFVGTIAALLAVCSISLAPPSIHRRSITIGAAATHVMIDSQRGLVSDRTATPNNFIGYTDEATLFASLLASDPVRYMIARQMHIRPDQITTQARGTGVGSGPYTATRSEQRANQIAVATRPYRLEMQPDPNLPVIAIYGQAPSAAKAVEIANLSVTALRRYVAENPSLTGVRRGQQIVVKQLGGAKGAVVNGQTTILVVLLTFFVAFGLSCALLFGGARVRRGFVAAGRGETHDDDSGPSVTNGRGALRRLADRGGDWPRTTRVMPWLVAVFLIVIWLIPFNDIQLQVSLPVDAKFDRLVLPILLIVWILSIAAGGTASPRLRLTRIHVGFLAFVGVVGIGIVLNQLTLNQTLEFTLATKKLSLLLSYGLMFAIIASSVRPTELRAFFKYSLVLAVICAVGSIVEYRFHYNVFYDLSEKLLGRFFVVTKYIPGQVDEMGRALTRGPSDHPLELAGMMTMALPLAVVGIIHSERRRDRVLYGIAASLLLAAAVATDRKSALLAPLAAIVTIAFYYRGKLLRLAPHAIALLIVVHLLSPGALGTVGNQLNPSNLGVSTVTDRAADYDAVRPDLWSHLAFGRGYGTYDHNNYRVLDSDMLNRLVDTGVLGICAFVFLLGCIVTAGWRTLRKPRAGPPNGLAVAAAAVAYFVLMFLFDVSSFPHVPYILLSLAGLLAVEQTYAKRPTVVERSVVIDPELLFVDDSHRILEPVPAGA